MDREDFERRRSSREDTLNFLEFAVLDDDGQVVQREIGRTLDVSPEGLRLETSLFLEEGQTLQVTLSLENDLVELGGRVVHVEPTFAEKSAAGVQFLAMSEEARRILENFLEAFRKRGPLPEETS